MEIRLPFKRDPAIGFMVAETLSPSLKVIPSIEDPVNDEEKFDLLIKMNLFVVDNLFPVAGRPAYPDKYEP